MSGVALNWHVSRNERRSVPEPASAKRGKRPHGSHDTALQQDAASAPQRKRAPTEKGTGAATARQQDAASALQPKRAPTERGTRAATAPQQQDAASAPAAPPSADSNTRSTLGRPVATVPDRARLRRRPLFYASKLTDAFPSQHALRSCNTGRQADTSKLLKLIFGRAPAAAPDAWLARSASLLPTEQELLARRIPNAVRRRLSPHRALFEAMMKKFNKLKRTAILSR